MNNINLIATSGLLGRELERMGDDFITVTLNDKEYVIDNIKRVPNHTDTPMSHLTLVIRDGGDGEIRR